MEPVFSFQISLHKKDQKILEQIRSYWGVGKITHKTSKSVQLRIRSIQELSIIIDHFEKYPLLTQKRADFILWREIIMIMRKEHLTHEGLIAIVNIRASLNLGLSGELKEAFPRLFQLRDLW